MVVKSRTVPDIETLADLHERLGFVPLHRIRMDPPPGTATEADVIRHMDGEPKRLYELIDGTLVEKAVGTYASIVGAALSRMLGNHIVALDLGLVSGADGPFRMLVGNVRYPDVSFIPWESLPDADELPEEAIWSVVPTLAVEVLSESNTAAEINRKIGELFDLGTKLIWVIDPPSKSAVVHVPGKKPKPLDPAGVLDGSKVLPGFKLPLADLFAATRRRKKSP